MSSRNEVLARIRGALDRTEGDAVPAPPPVRLTPHAEFDRVRRFTDALTALGGSVIEVAGASQAREQLDMMLAGKTFVSFDEDFSRDACSAAEIGVSSPQYALADTGTLVFLTESGEARLISLLPPRHIALIERDKILSGLDELLSLVPLPGVNSSAMLLITGPSRTADIEMRLVRGVHGPGEVTVMIVNVTV
jgi:L-lactate utilization protein LutC